MTLLELLDDYRIEYWNYSEHHHVSEGWVGLDCDQCSPGSGRVRLGINLTTLAASCYVCGKQSLGSVLSGLIDKPGKECWAILGRVERVATVKTTPGKLILPTNVGEMQAAHRRYLKGRKFDPDELEAVWGLGGTGRDSNLPWRIFIPISRGGEVLSWTTRELHDQGGRYHSAKAEQEKVSHKTLLYGEDNCLNAVVVHEGPADVWRTGPGAVCTFGLAVTSAQVRRLSKYPVRAICFDAGKDAQVRARRLAEQLSAFPGETHVIELDAKDAGSAGVAEIKELRRYLR